MPDMPVRNAWITCRLSAGALAALLCLGQAAVMAQTPPVGAAVRGTALTTNGKPLAGATLYLVDLPGSVFIAGFQDQGTVVTDSSGHFNWNVPPNAYWFSFPVSKISTAPACYALPLGPGWRATVALAQNFRTANADYGRRDLLEKATRKCETRWTWTGDAPDMAVTAPDTGQVSLTVRGPGGQALAGQDVQLVEADTFSHYEGAVVYEARTDAAGHLSLPRYPGLLRLQVSAPGVGFGSTGTFEVRANQVAAPALPPLAPFASVSGSVAPALVKPGAYVHLEDYGDQEHLWYDPQAVVNAKGQFRLDGVLPGQRRLVLVGGSAAAKAVEFSVQPGEAVRGLALTKADAPQTAPAGQIMAAPHVAAFVRGRVTDTAGRPVAGADIYALYSYDAGMRILKDLLTARTGPDGGYVIAALPKTQRILSLSLLAVRAGYPVAFASGQPDVPAGASPDMTGSFHADLVMPDGHPGLTVQVLQNGKPLLGASVHLAPQSGAGLFGADGLFEFGMFDGRLGHGPALQRATNCVQPSGVTDADGIVRFRDLPPGLWDVSAYLGNPPLGVSFLPSGLPRPVVSGNFRGAAVTTGTPGRVTLGVYPSPAEVSVRLLRPNGQPAAGFPVNLGSGPAISSARSSTGTTLDKNGEASFDLGEPGLFQITAHIRETATDNTYSASFEPDYEGSALVAVSPALPFAGPIVLHTVLHEPGSIRVRLRDAAGQPAAGTVTIGDPFNPAKYSLSVSSSGEGVFPAMPSGRYKLTAAFASLPALPTLGKPGTPFPSDAALSGLKTLVPQTVTVVPDTQTTVTLQPEMQGYVRGRLIVSGSPDDYGIYPEGYYDSPPTIRYDPATGRFVAGPFPPGKQMLRVQRTVRLPHAPAVYTTEEYMASGQDFPINVSAGTVQHLSLTLHLPPPGSAPVVPIGGRPVTGRVFLPDGITPAWGARAALVVPETDMPVRMAQADALGQLTIADGWRYPRFGSPPPETPPGSPAEPVLVAWLPGANGAVVVPASAEPNARLVLPPALSVSGRITAAGQPVGRLPSVFRVLAAYQGRGTLNALLSVETTASADGAFTLAGLTPGTYQVQAARDDLWLSPAQTLIVTGNPLPPLTLDILPPGLPVVLHLVNSLGQAQPGRTVTLDRPAGPLTGLLWPKTAAADSQGDLRLDGLEAGPHTVNGTASFTVLPQAGDAARPASAQTVVLTGPASPSPASLPPIEKASHTAMAP
jgi:hypothetical protein